MRINTSLHNARDKLTLLSVTIYICGDLHRMSSNTGRELMGRRWHQTSTAIQLVVSLSIAKWQCISCFWQEKRTHSEVSLQEESIYIREGTVIWSWDSIWECHDIVRWLIGRWQCEVCTVIWPTMSLTTAGLHCPSYYVLMKRPQGGSLHVRCACRLFQ